MILLISIIGIECYMYKNQKDTMHISVDNSELVYEVEISPNEKYIKSDKDKVYYKIQIFQDKNNLIIVNASSNSGFFTELQYTVESDEKILKSDIVVTWTTLMGSQQDTEKDNLAIANVAISKHGKVFNESKINYFNKGFEIITDTIKENN